jgi:ribonuclease BN (tRNA processing enzyme)
MSSPDFHRYGGNTACVEVRAPGAPVLMLDCGTGARDLGRSLVEQGRTDIWMLLSHTHMDHIFGLPFFAPAHLPECTITLGVPAGSLAAARDKIGRYINGIFHPLRMDGLAADLRFQAIEPDADFSAGPYRVRTLRLIHPGGTLGYRVDLGQHSICYLTDTGPLAQPGEGLMAGDEPTGREKALVDLVQGTDLLIMDATFTQEEYLKKVHWGHAYPEYTVRVGEAAAAKQLAFFHHSPDATDDIMDAITARWNGHTAPKIFPAQEGMVVDLSG